VAEAKTALAKSGLTRGKAILIGVLGVVLVGVLYLQFSSGSDEVAPAPASRRGPLMRVANPASQPSAKAEAAPAEAAQAGTAALEAMALMDEAKWTAPELATVVAYDPFALPAAFPQPAMAVGPNSDAIGSGAAELLDANALAEALAKIQTELRELQQRGVHVIIKERDEYVAMIGDRTVHVGDEINGFTVTAIGPSGVSVERKGPE
jgi:hypothetical protein